MRVVHAFDGAGQRSRSKEQPGQLGEQRNQGSKILGCAPYPDLLAEWHSCCEGSIETAFDGQRLRHGQAFLVWIGTVRKGCFFTLVLGFESLAKAA